MAVALLGAAMLVASTPPQVPDCPDSSAVAWQVEGGFATLRPEANARGDALLDSVARAGGRLAPPTTGGPSAYGDMVRALVDDGASARPLHELTWWDRATERYALAEDVLVPASVIVRATFAAGRDGTCTWTVDGDVASQPCAAARLAVRRGPAGLRAVVQVRAGGSDAVASGCLVVEERLIVGLGDSYASGEGNPDRPTRWAAVPPIAAAPRVPMPPRLDGRTRDRLGLWDRKRDGPLAIAPAGADAQWWDVACHRSLLSQQALAAIAFAAADRHRRVLFLSFACSGATVFDGVAGPRLEAPGAGRPGGLGAASPALRLSQLEQLAGALCAERAGEVVLPVPAAAPTWRALAIRGRRARAPRSVSVPVCVRWRRLPDALLLSVGGNDIGFGGVGAWALLPPRGRLAVDVVPTVNRVFGGGAAKGGFGLVCPGGRRESRCRLNTDRLVRELPAMLDLMDEALARSGLAAVPARIQTAYPLVTQAEDGEVRGCLGDELGGELYELLDEPWLPAYAAVLGLPVRADWLGRWSFGIQRREMQIIDGEVLAPLNAAIAAHAGWSVVGPDEMPATHGICAADGELSALLRERAGAARVRPHALRQFGWPRWVDGGWSDDRPSPIEWDAYAVRARWVRTATDAALTQSVFDGGVRRPLRDADDRVGEALSGAIHPSLPLHAAIAERVAARLGKELR